MRRTLCVVLALALLVSGCGRHSGIAVADLDAQTSAKLDTAINEVLSSAAVPGAIVGVWGPTGQYVRAFGVANTTTRAPMRPDFYHRIGSVTKTFTVTAVLQLVDEGKLGLDDPIAESVDKVPGGDKITLRQLARMQSGLFNYSMSLVFNRDLEADPRRRYSTQQLLDYSFTQPPNFPAGQGYEYSNTNAVLLGQVVEKVSGQSLPAFVREHITEPLGLNHTSFPDTNTIPDPHAQGYTQLTPTGPLIDSTDWSPSWASWAGAMISTLEDLRIWVPALATGKLLTPATQQQRLQTVAMPP
ncbi:MAG: serine hydrolase domain-containing protein, partial [[Mycobacterium] stephanolepidis]